MNHKLILKSIWEEIFFILDPNERLRMLRDIERITNTTYTNLIEDMKSKEDK